MTEILLQAIKLHRKDQSFSILHKLKFLPASCPSPSNIRYNYRTWDSVKIMIIDEQKIITRTLGMSVSLHYNYKIWTARILSVFSINKIQADKFCSYSIMSEKIINFLLCTRICLSYVNLSQWLVKGEVPNLPTHGFSSNFACLMPWT